MKGYEICAGWVYGWPELRAPRIRQLEQQRGTKACERLGRRWRCVGWVVGEIGHKGCETVVVGAILEQIADRHGIMAKAAQTSGGGGKGQPRHRVPVSACPVPYTHLTLPTNREV